MTAVYEGMLKSFHYDHERILLNFDIWSLDYICRNVSGQELFHITLSLILKTIKIRMETSVFLHHSDSFNDIFFNIQTI